jgi:hypothetical protein
MKLKINKKDCFSITLNPNEIKADNGEIMLKISKIKIEGNAKYIKSIDGYNFLYSTHNNI